MKRFQPSFVIVVFVCSFAPMMGQSPASLLTSSTPMPGSAIATLSFNAAVLGTAEAKKRLGALEQKYAPRQQQLQRLNDEVETLKKAVSDTNARLTEAERSQKLEELGAKQKQLQRLAEDFKNDSQVESQQVFQQIAEKMFAFLQDYSRQRGYTAVIERGTDTAPVVWYAANNVDITDLVSKGYDAKYAVKASGPPEAPSPPQPSKNGFQR